MPRKKSDSRTDGRVPLVPEKATPLHKDEHGRWVTELGAPAPLKNDRVEPNYVWGSVYSPTIQPADVEGMERGISGHTGPFIEAQKVDDRAVPAKRYQAFISEPSSVLSSGQFPASYTAGPREEDGTTDSSPNTSSRTAHFRGSATRNWEGAR